jgi:hypothetical protein
MANVDGVWDATSKTPMGEQKSVLTLKAEGSKLTGSNTAMGALLEILDGKIDGNKLTWRMEMKQPFPMTLTADVTVNGDQIEGTVAAGAFGKSPFKATRRA